VSIVKASFQHDPGERRGKRSHTPHCRAGKMYKWRLYFATQQNDMKHGIKKKGKEMPLPVFGAALATQTRTWRLEKKKRRERIRPSRASLSASSR